MKTILEVENLKKYFNTPRGRLHAVDGVTFRLEEGKTLGVVGESGCGKSTLGRTILHLLEPTSGKMVFDGQDISVVKKAQWKALRDDMQIIFQDPMSSLNPRMTVSEIIAEPLVLQKKIRKPQIGGEVKKLMDTVGLAARLENSYPHELDGGRRQRIGIARALALNPRFIVCDEPVSALDVSIQAQVLNLLQDLQEQRNLSYMFITHDLSVVKYISHDIVVMYLGQLVEKAPSEELFAKPAHPYTQALLGAIFSTKMDFTKKIESIESEAPSSLNTPLGCPFQNRCSQCREICKKERPILKKISEGHEAACHMLQGV